MSNEGMLKQLNVGSFSWIPEGAPLSLRECHSFMTIQAECESAVSQLLVCQQQLSEVKEQYSRHLLEVQADFKSQRASSQEDIIREKNAIKEACDKWVILLTHPQLHAIICSLHPL
jgi:hypothetical protein